MSTIKDQQQKIQGEIDKLEAMGGQFTGQAKRLRDSTFARFPILFTVLSTFGLVSTLYGMEKIIDATPWLAEKPWLILLVGLSTLVLTGALYKKLR